jgi:hypothetical protein
LSENEILVFSQEIEIHEVENIVGEGVGECRRKQQQQRLSQNFG